MTTKTGKAPPEYDGTEFLKIQFKKEKKDDLEKPSF